MVAERPSALRLLWLGAALLCVSLPARAQEEEDSAEGSRTKSSRASARLSVDESLGVFGGVYAEEPRDGILVDATLAGTLKLKKERLRLGLGYTYDPFTTKTFNFAEDEGVDEGTRLVQSMHEVDARATWKTHPWSSLRSKLELDGDLWFPKSDRDRRWSARLSAEARLGALRGLYGEVEASARLKKFPNYEVADRRIDQHELEGSGRIGYRWSRRSGVAAGLEVNLSDYLDARYDALAADGSVVRASESKDYVTSTYVVELEVRDLRFLELRLDYAYEINDSQHYDRRMTGRDESGDLIAKFIPDYYDYRRHRVSFRPEWTPSPAFRVSGDAELWVRDFDTYEARTESNRWTGDLRHDTSLDLGGEISWRVRRFSLLGARHGLFLTAFGSHLRRRSNMRREVSLATNFEVTRVFLGLTIAR